MKLQSTHLTTIVFQEQLTQVTTVVKIQLIQSHYIDLKPVLQRLTSQWQCKKYKIYDSKTNKYLNLHSIHPPNMNYHILSTYFSNDMLLIKYDQQPYSQISIPIVSSISDTQSDKKQRSRDRTISEVLAIVKKWREIHINGPNIPLIDRKVNLFQASQIMGISKKTLDDYYYQLRLGEKYGFNFHQHFQQKIGVLRTYIKRVKPKGRIKDRNQKYGKNLKILDEFQYNHVQIEKKYYKYLQKQDLIYSQDYNLNLGQCNSQQKQSYPINQFQFHTKDKSLQDQFYNDFGLMLSEPTDPFLSLGMFHQDNQSFKICNFNKNKQITNKKL